MAISLFFWRKKENVNSLQPPPQPGAREREGPSMPFVREQPKPMVSNEHNVQGNPRLQRMAELLQQLPQPGVATLATVEAARATEAASAASIAPTTPQNTIADTLPSRSNQEVDHAETHPLHKTSAHNSLPPAHASPTAAFESATSEPHINVHAHSIPLANTAQQGVQQSSHPINTAPAPGHSIQAQPTYSSQVYTQEAHQSKPVAPTPHTHSYSSIPPLPPSFPPPVWRAIEPVVVAPVVHQNTQQTQTIQPSAALESTFKPFQVQTAQVQPVQIIWPAQSVHVVQAVQPTESANIFEPTPVQTVQPIQSSQHVQTFEQTAFNVQTMSEQMAATSMPVQPPRMPDSQQQSSHMQATQDLPMFAEIPVPSAPRAPSATGSNYFVPEQQLSKPTTADQFVIEQRDLIEPNLFERASNAFYAADGTVFWTTEELGDALVHMSDETFSHHVSYARNDFANWIDGCFTGDTRLVGALLTGLDRQAMIRLFLRLHRPNAPRVPQPHFDEKQPAVWDWSPQTSSNESKLRELEDALKVAELTATHDPGAAREAFIQVRTRVWSELTDQERGAMLPKMRTTYERLRAYH